MVRFRVAVINPVALTSQQPVGGVADTAGPFDLVSPSERRQMSEMFEEYRLAEDKFKAMYDMLRKVSDPMRGEQADIDAALALIGHREGNVLQFDELLRYANATKASAVAELGKTKMSSKQQTTLEAFTMLGGSADGTGHIMLETLISTLRAFKLTVNVDALREILDKDGNGQVDLEEFSWFYNDALAAGAFNSPSDQPALATLRESSSTRVGVSSAFFSEGASPRAGPGHLTSEPSSGIMDDDAAAAPDRDIKRSSMDDDDEDDGDSVISHTKAAKRAPGALSPGGKMLSAGGAAQGQLINANEIMKRLQLALQQHVENDSRRRGTAARIQGFDGTKSTSRAEHSMSMTTAGILESPVSQTSRAPARPVSSAPASRAPKQSRALVPYVATPTTSKTPREPSSGKTATSPRPDDDDADHRKLMSLTTKCHQADAKVTALKLELEKRMLAAQQTATELEQAQKEQELLHGQVLREMRNLRHKPPKKLQKASTGSSSHNKGDNVKEMQAREGKNAEAVVAAPVVTKKKQDGGKEKTAVEAVSSSPAKNESSTADPYSDSFDVTPPSSDTSSTGDFKADDDDDSRKDHEEERKKSPVSSRSSSSSRRTRSTSTSTRLSKCSSTSATKPVSGQVPALKPTAPREPVAGAKTSRGLKPAPKHVAPVTPRALRLMKHVGDKSPAASSIRCHRSPTWKEDELLDMIIRDADSKKHKADDSKGKKAPPLAPESLKQRNPYKELLVASCRPAADGSSSDKAAVGDQMQLWTR